MSRAKKSTQSRAGVGAETPPGGEEEPQPRSRGRAIWDQVSTLVVAVVIALAIRTFLIEPFRIPSGSMLPTLLIGDHLFVNKFLYNFDEIDRGDVVVFKFPIDPTKSYIKRVIGLPGDVVEIIDGSVRLNGKPYLEPYVLKRFRDRGTYPRVVVPEGEYFVLGDHRNTSNDSRTWGTVEHSYVTGKAVFSYWPLERFGVLE